MTEQTGYPYTPQPEPQPEPQPVPAEAEAPAVAEGPQIPANQPSWLHDAFRELHERIAKLGG